MGQAGVSPWPVVLALISYSSAIRAADFNRDIRPVLENSCLPCHGAKAAGGVRVDNREALLKAGERFLTSLNLPPTAPHAMPPGGPQLAKPQRDAIREWIRAGAEWPTGLTLSAPSGKKADGRALAEDLYKRIAAASKETEMRPYKTAIPGTDVSFEMLPIPAGEFTMGTPDSEPGRKPGESPQHRVRIEPFWMGKFEVTWDEYRLFMFSNQAGEIKGKDEVVDAVSRPTRPYVEMSFGMGINGFPAISMTQHAANKYAEWLSARTGQFYRLPTEAEWEYACRAGTTTAYPFGENAAQIGDYAWYADNSDGKYRKVGTKKPNPWGLHDMFGNVMEWTLDQYAPDSYSRFAGKTALEPWVVATKPYPHAVRGGSWVDDAAGLRCGARVASDASWKMQDPQLPKSIWYHTDAQWLGFRLVRPLKLPTADQMFRYWNSGVEKE